MIIPWMKGFLGWNKAPLTWTLIILNLLIFLQTTGPVGTSGITQNFSNVEMMVLTGQLYDQYLRGESTEVHRRKQNDWMILGGQGLKDPKFIEMAETTEFFGDQIAIRDWKVKVHLYQEQLREKPTTVFGLRAQNSSPLTWVTYQFMHASWMHLTGNMLMLLIFGATTELVIGSLGLVFIYIFSGFAGAWAFLILGHDTLAPMIGASGALSGVMAFYAAFEKKRRVSFFYFVSPMPGYFGWIYLPTMLIFPLCFLSDFAGYLSTPDEIGTGVAYTAHIGGAVFGALLGLSLRYFRRSLWVRWISQF